MLSQRSGQGGEVGAESFDQLVEVEVGGVVAVIAGLAIAGDPVAGISHKLEGLFHRKRPELLDFSTTRAYTSRNDLGRIFGMPERKLIFVDSEWIIAKRTPAGDFRVHGRKSFITADHVWVDPNTTALICEVGEERAVADLPPHPLGQ